MVKFLPDILPNELPDHAILYVTHCNITISKLFHLNQKLFEFSDIHIIFCNFIFVYLIITCSTCNVFVFGDFYVEVNGCLSYDVFMGSGVTE